MLGLHCSLKGDCGKGIGLEEIGFGRGCVLVGEGDLQGLLVVGMKVEVATSNLHVLLLLLVMV